MKLIDLFTEETYEINVTHDVGCSGYESVELECELPREVMIALCKLYIKCGRDQSDETQFGFEFGSNFDEYLPFDCDVYDELVSCDDPFDLTEEEIALLKKYDKEFMDDAVHFEEQFLPSEDYDEDEDEEEEEEEEYDLLRETIDNRSFLIYVG